MIGLLLKKWLLSHLARLIGCGAAALSVFAVLLGARQAGKKAERVEQMKKALEVKNGQLNATLEVPRTRSELVNWLQRGKF